MKKSTIYSIIGIILILFSPVSVFLNHFLDLNFAVTVGQFYQNVPYTAFVVPNIIVGVLVFVKGLLSYYLEEKKWSG